MSPFSLRSSCLYLDILAFLRAPVFLCSTPFATALSTAFVASEMSVSNAPMSSSVHAPSLSADALTNTFFMRVVISLFLALLYKRSWTLFF